MSPNPPTPEHHVDAEGVPEHMIQNVEAILAHQAKAEERAGRQQRLVERTTGLIARPRTLYFIVFAVVFWCTLNGVLWALGRPVLDPPPFYWLQGVVGVCALLMTTMVLTTQNRQAKHAEQRSHLDLQVNLLAEQKVAKLIALMEELRRDLPIVKDRADPVAEAMTQAVNATAVITVLEESLEPGEKSALEPPPNDASDEGSTPER